VKKRYYFGLIALGVFVVAMWIGVPWLTSFAVSKVGESDIARSGAAGDMYGAVGSLFAGLGAYAVFVVLAFDLAERRKDAKHRQEQYRPFVTMQVKRARIYAAEWQEQYFTFSVYLEADIANVTEAIALNVDLKGQLEIAGTVYAGQSRVLNFPLSSSAEDEKRTASIMYSFRDGDALEAYKAFVLSGANSRASLSLLYESVNETPWQTSFAVDLSGAPEDQELVNSVARYMSDESIGQAKGVLGGGNVVNLAIEPVPKSWNHARVPNAKEPRRKKAKVKAAG
jgi:hypothetical protein